MIPHPHRGVKRGNFPEGQFICHGHTLNKFQFRNMGVECSNFGMNLRLPNEWFRRFINWVGNQASPVAMPSLCALTGVVTEGDLLYISFFVHLEAPYQLEKSRSKVIV